MIVHLEPDRWEDWPPSASVLPCCGMRVDQADAGLVTTDPSLVTCHGTLNLEPIRRELQARSPVGNRYDLFVEQWSMPGVHLADGSWVTLESGTLEIGIGWPTLRRWTPRWRRWLHALLRRG